MVSLTGAAALALVMLGLAIWQGADWIEARAEESREQARRVKLENDKLERELAQGAAPTTGNVADDAVSAG